MTKSFLLSGVLILGAGAGSVLAQGPYNQARYDPNRPYEDDVRTTYVGESEYDLPAFVSVVDGYAELDRDGQSSRDIENVPLEAGDRLRTTRGRVEILFDDGSVLALDEHTTVTFLSATEVELGAGRVRAQWRDRNGLSIHTMAGSAIMRTQGDYRITLAESRRGDAEIEVAVARGSAELANDHGRTIVREGTRALTTAAYAPSTPYAYSPPRDAFERWTEELAGDRYGVESARYLPDELRYYGGVFDRHGAWQHHPSYGYVWYPRVSVGWRPYYGGRWSFVVGFGYSWVGGSRWSWPTHHHGRWDRVGGRYFWVPTRPSQRRFVGYSAPRPSYTAPVNYYNRPTVRTTRPQNTYRSPQSPDRSPQNTYRQAPTAVPRGSQSRPQTTQQPPRVQRSPEPQARPESRPQSGAQSRQPSRTTTQSPAQAPRSSERPQRAEPAPQQRRSSPSETSAPPPSGSRTPSRSAAPPRGDAPPRTSGSSDNRGQSGTAVRRRGGGQ